jgi:hypothetical protein
VRVLPGEQPEEIEQQRTEWIAGLQADGPLEEALVERAFEAWHQLGRTSRASQARLEKQMHDAEVLEKQQEWDAVLELGNRLFFDRRGPWQMYPNRAHHWSQLPTSGDAQPGDPDQPVRLVHRLESSAAGCRWLLERWNELAAILQAGDCWRSPDRFKAIRLLGKQPLDVTVEPDVLQIFLACQVINPHPKGPFHDVYREIGESDGDPVRVLQPILKELPAKRSKPSDPSEARRILANLVDRATARLKILLTDHEARAGDLAASAQDRHAFDLSPDAELMRRYEMGSDRAFHRALERLRLFRKDQRRAADGESRQYAGEAPKAEGDIQNGAPASDTPVPCPAGLSPSEKRSPKPDAGGSDTVESDAGQGDEKLRNEPIAACIDRSGSAGQADANVRRDEQSHTHAAATGHTAGELPRFARFERTVRQSEARQSAQSTDPSWARRAPPPGGEGSTG